MQNQYLISIVGSILIDNIYNSLLFHALGIVKLQDYSLVLLLISNLTNGLRLHQFLVTKISEVNKSVKTDANGAH